MHGNHFLNKIYFNLSKASTKTSFVVVVIKLEFNPSFVGIIGYISLCLLFVQLKLCVYILLLKALVCADKFVEPIKNLQVTKSPWRKFGQWENASRSGYIRNLMEYRPNLSKYILQYNSVEHLFFISLVHNSRQQTNRNSC